MNIIKFTAKIQYASKEDDHFMAGFADDKYDYDNYVILQKAFVFDEEDIELRLDGEYIEINSQENSGYIMLQNASISQDKFIINLKPNENNENYIDAVHISLFELKINEELLNYLKEILGEKLEVLL